MSDRVLRTLAPWLIAATILAIASGSSSVRWVIEHTRGGIRWGALVVLLVFALGWAAARRFEDPFRAPAPAGAWFAALAVTSTAWSVDARLTFERAGTLVMLLGAAWGFSCAARGRRDVVGVVLDGILLGAVAVAIASLVTLALTHANAVQPATLAYGARFEGYGQNPNTLAMLLALALPIAGWRAATAQQWKRLAAGAAAVLLFGELAATGSRASLAAALVGVLLLIAFAPRPPAYRIGAAAAIAAVFAAGAVAAHLAKPATVAQPQPHPPPGRLAKDAERFLPLDAEIGLPKPGTPIRRRGLFSSSGRFEAWRGAIRQSDARPTAGYGFGTESRVFVDRYYGFDSSVVENAYLGLYLQLGVVGLLSFAAVIASALLGIRRLPEDVVLVPAAVVLGGLVLAVGQSFFYSVGAPGTLPFWFAAFLATSARTTAAKASAPTARGSLGAARCSPPRDPENA